MHSNSSHQYHNYTKLDTTHAMLRTALGLDVGPVAGDLERTLLQPHGVLGPVHRNAHWRPARWGVSSLTEIA